MSTTSNINGIELYNALVSGICKVISRHEHLNKINVFLFQMVIQEQIYFLH